MFVCLFFFLINKQVLREAISCANRCNTDVELLNKTLPSIPIIVENNRDIENNIKDVPQAKLFLIWFYDKRMNVKEIYLGD